MSKLARNEGEIQSLRSQYAEASVQVLCMLCGRNRFNAWDIVVLCLYFYRVSRGSDKVRFFLG